jgi:hypothetical protein
MVSVLYSSEAVSFYDSSIMTLLYVILFGLVGLLIPALLWNYAKQDSIFAVWNFSKAVHIMGTYFGKYLWNTILFIVLRLTHVINWSWWWVFCPLWGPVVVVIAMMIIVFIASMIY